MLTVSGVAATRFSRGKVSFGMPTDNLLYGVPFGAAASSTGDTERWRVQDWIPVPVRCILWRAEALDTDRRIISFVFRFRFQISAFDSKDTNLEDPQKRVLVKVLILYK